MYIVALCHTSVIINIYATILIVHCYVYDYGCETGTLLATITKINNSGLPDILTDIAAIILILNDSF